MELGDIGMGIGLLLIACAVVAAIAEQDRPTGEEEDDPYDGQNGT